MKKWYKKFYFQKYSRIYQLLFISIKIISLFKMAYVLILKNSSVLKAAGDFFPDGLDA